MTQTPSFLETFMLRLLWINPASIADNKTKTANAEKTFGLSLLFSGIRCILQYAILPFVLPMLGVAGGVATNISILINIVAIVALVFSVRRFWQTDYARKREYTFVAGVTLVILIAFILLELGLLS
jgi:hypothetical protein